MNGLRKILTTCLLMLLGCSMAMAIELTPVTTGHLPVSDPGTLKRYTAFCGALNASYTVDIWFPEGYDAGSETRYPVIYMQDGQNLFDPSISFAKVAWEVDKALGRLIAAGEVTAPIIVGIHNRGVDRPADYIPEKPITEYMNKHQQTLSGMDAVTGGKYYGNEYAAFVATELKPAVDALFPTIPDREHTFIMGSSMGALASLYALCEYPDIYGGSGCLSTHWIGNFDSNSTIFPTAMLDYLQASLPSAASHKLYLDRGTKGLDAYYETWENKAVELAESKGYSQSAGSLYVYVAQGADHNEYFWQQRVDKALVFFLHNLSKDVSPVIDDDALLLTPVPGGVEILSSKGGTITVSDMQGKTQLLRVSPFTPTRLPLPSGLYVIGHRKIKL